MKIIAVPNEARTAFHIPSEYSKALLVDWLKKHDAFEITPIVADSVKRRRYLEGAIVPAYCKWQYGIDPRSPKLSDTRRFLFKRDFAYEIVENRAGEPIRAPQSTRGRTAELVDAYTAWALENGAPVPNADLYKLYRNKWSTDHRFPTFHDWLAFLKIEEDAMPSAETLAVLQDDAEPAMPEYPDTYRPPAF